MNLNDIDVIVVGGGPAGSSAASLLARNQRKVLVIDGSQEDGYLGSLKKVAFFPGIDEPIRGSELVERFRRQAQTFGADYRSAKVHKISVEEGRIKVSVGGDQVIECKSVVLASGAAQRVSDLHGEKDFLGLGVSYDAETDGPSFLNKTVAVVGKNRLAAEEALLLSRYAEKVILIVPSSKIDADESFLNVLRENKKLELHFSASLKKIEGTDHVGSIVVFIGGQEKNLSVDGVFSYMNDHKPTNEYAKDAVELSEGGAVKVDNNLQTSAKGIFACGDILCSRPQLPAIAAAQGILAGINVDKYLSENR